MSGTGSLTKSGAGNLTLAGNNTYAGGTTISGGKLSLGSGGALGSVAGNISNNGSLAFNRSDDHTFSHVISGSGDVTIETGIVRFSSAQTYAGPTSIESGAILVLSTTVDQGLAATSTVDVASGGVFDFSNRDLEVAGLTGAGSVYSFGGSNGHLSVNTAPGQNQVFAGALGAGAAAFDLTKAGAGTLTLAGTLTYTGATTISGGTLALGASASLASSSGLDLGAGGILDLTAKSGGFALGSGQTLSGTGTINLAASQTLTLAGTLAPGNSPGITTVNGNLVIDSSAIIAMELAGSGGVAGTDFDQIVVTGTMTAGGTLNVTAIDDFTPSIGQSFQLFNASSIGGTFATINLPTLSGATWNTSALYSTGALSVSAVPEPGSFALLFGVAALGFTATRRRRRNGAKFHVSDIT